MQRLNIKLVIFLVGSFLVVVVGGFFLHRWQTRSGAAKYKVEGEKLVKEGNYSEAAVQFGKGVKANPEDTDSLKNWVLARYEQVLNGSDSPNSVYRQLLKAQETPASAEHPEFGERLDRAKIVLLMRMRQWSNARDEIVEMQKSRPKDALLEFQLAECNAFSGRQPAALQQAARLIGVDLATGEINSDQGTDQKNVEAYALLAGLLLNSDAGEVNLELADKVMGKLVEINGDKAAAHLQRGTYLQSRPLKSLAAKEQETERKDNSVEARTEIEKALAIAPDDADAILTAGQVAWIAGDLEAAQKRMEAGTKQFPKDPRMWVLLTRLQMQQKNAKAAEAAARDGLAKVPADVNLLLILAEIQIHNGDAVAARDTLGKLDKMKAAGFDMEVLQGRLYMLDKNWTLAAEKLEHARKMAATQPERLSPVLVSLADCYEQLNQADRQNEIAEQLSKISGGSMTALITKANGLQAKGDNAGALKLYEMVEKQITEKKMSDSPGIWMRLLKLRLAEQASKPREKQDWAQIDKMVDSLRGQANVNESAWAVLAAEVATRKGDPERAEKLIRDANANDPKNPQLWAELFEIQRIKLIGDDETKALPILERAEKVVGDNIVFRLARLNTWNRVGGKRGKDEITKLAALPITTYSDQDQTRWLEALSAAQHRLGDLEGARQSWRALRKFRDDVNYYMQSFEFAREADDGAEMQTALQAMAKLTGKNDSQLLFAQAVQLANRVITRIFKEPNPSKRTLTAQETDDLARARTLLNKAKNERAGWYVVPQILGDIDVLEGKRDDAIENYKLALELGPSNATVIRRLIALQASAGQFQQALALFPRLGEDRSEGMDRMEADLRVQVGDFKQAAELAKAAVPDNSNNSAGLYWRAMLLSRARMPEDAEKLYRAAVDADPQRPEAWIGLIKHLLETNRRNEAMNALVEADTKLKPEVKSIPLAQLYEASGNFQAAEKNFKDALLAAPENYLLANQVAAFYIRAGKFAEARKLLDKVVASAPVDQKVLVTAARRQLAQIMALSGSYQDHLSALAEIEKNTQAGELAVEDRILTANLYAVRDDATSHQKAIALLASLEDKDVLAPDQLMVLARLYEQTGKWKEAHVIIDRLRERAPGNIALLAEFVTMMLRNDEPENAEDLIRQIEQMEKSSKTSFGAAALRAQLLVKQGKNDEAAEKLTSLVTLPQKDDRKGDVLAVALLLDQLKLYEPATAYFTAFNDMEHSIRSVAYLATHLGQQRLISESLDLCDKKLVGVTDVAAAAPLILAGINTLNVRQGEAKPEHFAMVEKWLKRLLDKNPDAEFLIVRLCDLYQLWGKYPEAEREYRAALAKKNFNQEQRAILANNFAYMLALLKKDLDDSLKLINESIDAIGPRASMLDTRAMVQLARNQPDAALQDIQTAILDDSHNGSYYFHRALAEQALKQVSPQAADSLKLASDHGFKPKELSPLEYKLYESLAKATSTTP